MLKIINVLTLGAFSSLRRKGDSPLKQITDDLMSKERSLDMEDVNQVELEEVLLRYKRLRMTAYVVATAWLYSVLVLVKHAVSGEGAEMHMVYSVIIVLFMSQYYLILCYLGHVTRDTVNNWSDRHNRKHSLKDFLKSVAHNKTALLMPKL